MFKCECGKQIKTKAGFISHSKACNLVQAFPDGIWKVVRKGVFRPFIRW